MKLTTHQKNTIASSVAGIVVSLCVLLMDGCGKDRTEKALSEAEKALRAGQTGMEAACIFLEESGKGDPKLLEACRVERAASSALAHLSPSPKASITHFCPVDSASASAHPSPLSSPSSVLSAPPARIVPLPPSSR